jgi:hypothetical protein
VLRRLIVESLPAAFGECELIHHRLPCVGAPLLILDANRRPVLVGFDPADAGRALLTALAAWDDVRAHPDWVVRLHPSLTHEAILHELGLAVFARTPPPGAACLMPGQTPPAVFMFRTLRVNGELALLVDPWRPTGEAEATEPFQELEDAARIIGAAVSREEKLLSGDKLLSTVTQAPPPAVSLSREEEVLFETFGAEPASLCRAS